MSYTTNDRVRAALLAYHSGDMDWDSQDEELMRLALAAAYPALTSELDRLREALQKAETVIDLMADVVTYDATMQGPKILGVNGSAARRASEAARNYFIAKDRAALSHDNSTQKKEGEI